MKIIESELYVFIQPYTSGIREMAAATPTLDTLGAADREHVAKIVQEADLVLRDMSPTDLFRGQREVWEHLATMFTVCLEQLGRAGRVDTIPSVERLRNRTHSLVESLLRDLRAMSDRAKYVRDEVDQIRQVRGIKKVEL